MYLFDFSKAFESVIHQTLLGKLNIYGSPGTALSLLTSYRKVHKTSRKRKRLLIWLADKRKKS